MDKYISDWLRIIEEMKNDNTYKVAWGRAILECVYINQYEIVDGNLVILKQSDIVNKMIKYYWNQTYFFKLIQGKNPVILQIVRQMISEYKEKVSIYPTTWDKAETYFFNNKSQYNRYVSNIISNARVNVCPRFRNVSGEVLSIYDIDNQNKTLFFNKYNIETLKEYSFVLSKLLNFKWAQLLERFNTVPKINKKISDSGNTKIRRNSLKKYKEILLKYYHGDVIRDFYTDEIVDVEDIHIDHVIPWSFIYSDDIWNLVITKPTTNLSKGNNPPSEKHIEKLKSRNVKLLKEIGERDSEYRKSIQSSIEKDLIDKLYINMKS